MKADLSVGVVMAYSKMLAEELSAMCIVEKHSSNSNEN